MFILVNSSCMIIRNCNIIGLSIMASHDSDLPVPRESSDITPSWLSKIFNIPESEMDALEISTNSFSGSGNLSNIVRVHLERKGKQLNYIIKLLPLTTDEEILEVIYADKFDQKEVFFYRD